MLTGSDHFSSASIWVTKMSKPPMLEAPFELKYIVALSAPRNGDSSSYCEFTGDQDSWLCSIRRSVIFSAGRCRVLPCRPRDQIQNRGNYHPRLSWRVFPRSSNHSALQSGTAPSSRKRYP